jgi:oligopeptide/dipeptide ABC transporter ATP-binding protein
MRTRDIIEEPLRIHRLGDRATRRRRVEDLLDLVGLPKSAGRRLPHEFSGGQRQRICIARALALNPDLVVADEPVSALDVSIQAQIINLLEELQREFDLTYIFIAHDLAVVRHIADRVAVLYLGKLMEVGGQEALYGQPLHPYTRALIDAAPIPDPMKERATEHRPLSGEIPSPMAPPPGCVFHTRCPLASQECRETVPALRGMAPGHEVACIKA